MGGNIDKNELGQSQESKWEMLQACLNRALRMERKADIDLWSKMGGI